MNIKATLHLIQAASNGDQDAINEIHECRKAKMFVAAMRKLVETEKPRDALMMVGRHYIGISVRKLGEIFNLHHTRVIQITNRRRSF